MTSTPRIFDTSDFLARLVSVGALDKSAAERVRSASASAGAPVERSVLELGLAEEDEVFRQLAVHHGLPFIAADDIEFGILERTGLEPDFLERVQAIPVSMSDNRLVVASSDPNSQRVLHGISFYLSSPVVAAITAPSTIAMTLARLRPSEEVLSPSDTDVERLRALANDGPIVKFVNELVGKAATINASDVHIEATDRGARVRFRVDGRLQVDGAISDERRAAVVSRIKVMSELNISEKRRPQDGRMTVAVRGRNIDVRVSTLPTQFGESIVLRLLDQANVDLEWTSLGFSSQRVCEIRKLVSQPNGIFLVAGPTGSGKTTTLYTALSELNQDDRKILTVEDPIEYALPGINQTQVDAKIDMTFATALRAILRQDPDVVLVGEIRDQETAEIAVRAALIGRLVLSTIHTNDSISAITRLLDLGVPPFLLSATLRGVLSQRLVGRICSACGSAGCTECGNSGLNGRQVLSELLEVSTSISDAISSGQSRTEILKAAEDEGFTSIRRDADALLSQNHIRLSDVENALGLI